MKRTLAIDIGGTKFAMAGFEDGQMVCRESQGTNRGEGREWMLAQVVAIAKRWQTQRDFDRCGIGFGGPVHYGEQRVALSTHVGGWRDFHLPAWLHEQLGIPAIMDNDANVGALGEAFYGAGRGYSSLMYLTLSTGIGGGICLNGDIWRGADSYAGEIGHVTVRPDGPECLCGARGCLERLCSGLWLERDYGKPAYELMEDQDFMRRYAVDLALGLKTCIMLLNPSRIVLGGGISKSGADLLNPLRAELRRQITDWSSARIDVAIAELGDDSVLYGALRLADELDNQ